jgi:hypothetical protein
MRRFLPLTAALLVTACGGGEERQSSENLRTFDVAEESASTDASAPGAPPMIGPSAAPGVAFNYRYAFRLPGERIAAVQEQHAQACEKLGLDRCRITGMRYRLMGKEDVVAMLAFKLDPAIARQFGKNGIETVTRAEGMLIDSEITGEDAGADIKAATRNEGQLGEELRRVEQQLARSRAGSAEAAELQAQAERIRESMRANRATRTERQESLAKTPMVFNYGSGDVIPGFDTRSSLSTALDDASENFVGGVAAMLVIFVTLLPWVLLGLLFFWIFRRVRKTWLRSTDAKAETAPSEVA